MNRLIGSVTLIATLLISGTGVTLAQAEPSLDEGERMAASGDIAGATQVYQAVTEAQPESSEAFARLGGMQLLGQQYAEAVKSFQHAISLGDDGARSFIGMGMAYLHMGAYGPARAAFTEARARGSEHSADVEDIITWLDSRDQDDLPPVR